MTKQVPPYLSSQLTDSQKEIRDFIDIYSQEMEHNRKMLFMSEARLEGKTIRYNEVPTKETLNNPEFKNWRRKKKQE